VFVITLDVTTKVFNFTKTIIMKEEIHYMKEMMKSCYAYNSLNKTNMYLTSYKHTLGEEVFNEVYDSYKKYLEENYKVVKNVGTDSDGLTYNSLVKIK
jgi:glutaminase